MHMHIKAMTKADLIAVRAGQEQGRRWGIDLNALGGFETYLVGILSSPDMRMLYELKPAEWE